MQVVGQWGPTGPQTVKAIANAMGYSPEADGMTLLLRTPHTGNMEKAGGSASSSTQLPSFQRHLRVGKLRYGLLDLRKTDLWEQSFLISDTETNSHMYGFNKTTHTELLPQLSYH